MSAMQKTSWNSSAPPGADSTTYKPDPYLCMLIEGAALGVPEVDAQAYHRFRENLEQLIHKLAAQLPTEDKLALVQSIVHEFDVYRADSETAIRQQLMGWRDLVSKLLGKLMSSLGIELHNPEAFSLTQQIRRLATAADIRAWDERLDSYLNPKSGIAPAEDATARLRAADNSTLNDNAAGLPGGGAALERLEQLIRQGERGFVVLFRLGCMELINERFGDEAVQDSVMAIAAYLTHSLHREDTVYHWSDESLLAIICGRTNEHILTAELKRIALMNRDVNISIGTRVVMLRVPIEFEVVPIGRLRSANDIRKLNLSSAAYTH